MYAIRSYYVVLDLVGENQLLTGVDHVHGLDETRGVPVLPGRVDEGPDVFREAGAAVS